ncbi:MAG: ammonium transporter, partial [Chthoniobacterales bacterium]
MRLILIGIVAVLALAGSKVIAQEPSPSPAPSLEQRVTALEAYLANADPKTADHIAGPGHNAWMMTSA